MTKIASRFAALAAIALASVSSFAVSAPAQAAQPAVRIAVGNLNSPAQAVRFDRDLNTAADDVCTAMEKGPSDGSKVAVSHAACVAQLRADTLAELSTRSRTAVALAAATSTSASVAMAGR